MLIHNKTVDSQQDSFPEWQKQEHIRFREARKQSTGASRVLIGAIGQGRGEGVMMDLISIKNVGRGCYKKHALLGGSSSGEEEQQQPSVRLAAPPSGR